jgi:hypothetical protein
MTVREINIDHEASTTSDHTEFVRVVPKALNSRMK